MMRLRRRFDKRYLQWTQSLSDANRVVALAAADALRKHPLLVRIGYQGDVSAGEGYGHLVLYDASDTAKWVSESIISLHDAYLIADELERNVAVRQYWTPSLRTKKR